VNTTPLPLFGSSTRLKVPINGDFFADMVLYLKINPIKTIHKNNKLRYCEYPGHRIIREVRFVMDGIVLDRYGTDDINFYYDFHVSKSQQEGWKRCVGQEVGKRAVFIQDPTNQEVKEEKVIFDGFQTLKHQQDAMEIFLPLQFWFCDPKFAISNYNVEYDKVFIEIDIADETELIMVADYASDGGLYESPVISDCALFTNHIYTIPEVADLFIHRTQFNLVRVHKSIQRILNKPYDSVILNDLKFAVENIMIRFRPVENTTNENKSETWINNNVISYTEIPYPCIFKVAGVKTLGYTPAYYYTESPAVDTIAFVCNGSTIYDSNSTTFYDSYLPYRYGKDTVITPSSAGSYLMTFSLYPHKEQPSGYMNLSNSKDNYLVYSSSYIGPDTLVNMYISAKVINFLYLTNGSLTLRFAT
jgi:hypothetical protein